MKNKYEIRGDVTAIFVALKGQRFETLIDTADLEKLKKYNVTWSVRQDSTRNYIYVAANYKETTIRLCRVLFDRMHGMEVDHINHDTLDNRRSCNLRLATRSQNTENWKGARSDSKSKVRGVWWEKASNKWKATVHSRGKQVFCKFYDDLEEANKAVMHARAKYLPFSREAREIHQIDESIFVLKPFSTNNTSKVRGVTWNKRSRKWKGYVNLNRKFYHVGYFDDLNDARLAVERFRKTLLSG